MREIINGIFYVMDNAIDADVDLTDEHLRELGLPLGVRLKLLRAVAALSTGQTPARSTHRRRAPSGHSDKAIEQVFPSTRHQRCWVREGRPSC
jgi:hypothetical protein